MDLHEFGVCLQYAIRKKQLNFGGDPDPDTDSAANFFFKHRNAKNFQGSLLQVALKYLECF